MATVATRLLSIIWTLQSRPLTTAGELAADLGVSQRTVHRYMGMLDEMGIPIASERGRGGGFYLVRGYKLPPMRFTAEEASALYLGADVLRRMGGLAYRDAALAAQAKLDNVLPDELRQQVAQARQHILLTDFDSLDYGPWEGTLTTLRQAIRDQRRLAMTYRAVQAQAAERAVDAYALVHRWGYWYLVAHCHQRQEVRTFRVDRIIALSPLEERFSRPADFDVERFLEQEVWPYTYHVRMRFCPQAALRAYDERGAWETLREGEDGSVEVTYRTSDLYWAARVALRYGPDVRVLEPPEVAAQVRAQAQGLIQQYQDS
jgi:predicted DNA-binding transcriptional regulator YafY